MPADPEATRQPFTADRAQELLDAAADTLRLDVTGARLIRLGENAIFRLRDEPFVVRVGRSPDKIPVAEREICVAGWLAGRGVAVARPRDEEQGPVIVHGHPVSVWHRVEPGEPAPGVVDLADLLRAVHAVDDEPPCAVGPPDPLGLSERRLAAIDDLPDADRALFATRITELREEYADVAFALRPGLIHGDAHPGNLLGRAGAAVLGDFEATAIGPREGDLIPLAISRLRFGRSADTYRQFTDRYGFDVTTWSGFGVLRRIRELYMTVWLAQNAGNSAREAAELELRIRTIRERDDTTEWHAF